MSAHVDSELADNAVVGADAAVEILRVPWNDARAVALRAAMDAEISPRYSDRFAGRDAEEAARMAASFAIRPEDIASTFILTVDGVPAAHAALRALGDEWELKRLVTLTAYRGRGLSQALIAAVEADVLARGGTRLILQTGDRQPEAVSLYLKLGFERIPTFEPYTIFVGSQCFARELSGG
jgi:GNAT superfamily N-acetyltransferase